MQYIKQLVHTPLSIFFLIFLAGFALVTTMPWSLDDEGAFPFQNEFMTADGTGQEKRQIQSHIRPAEAQYLDAMQKRNDYFIRIIILFLSINALVFAALFPAKRRKNAFERTAVKAKERAESTLRSIADAVIVTDKEGRITFLNEEAEILTGYRDTEAMHMSLGSVFHIVDCDTGEKVGFSVESVIKEGQKSRLASVMKLIGKTGLEYIISGSAAPIHDADGNITGAVVVFRDDMEHHERHATLQESEGSFRRLIENVREHYFFYRYDTNGALTYVSNSITEVLGYSCEEFLTHCIDYLTDDPMNKTAMMHRDNCIEGEPQSPYEISIHHRDGSVRYLEITESPVVGDNGQVVAVEGIAKDITQHFQLQNDLQEQKDLLEHKAHHDTLTGLPNRLLFLDRLKQSIRRLEHSDEKAAVMFIDLDHFKEVNDSLGHYVGDRLLKEVANRLKKSLRDTDTIARLGGDEFTILVDGIENSEWMVDLVQNLMHVMEEPIIIEEHLFYVSMSIGITFYPDDGGVPEILLKNADTAMYKAKEDGRNTYCFYTEKMTEKAFERIMIENGVRQALEEGDLTVHYQPQVNGLNGEILGMEALVRWPHNTIGFISPERFISIAEDTGLIVPLDQWVMRMAMGQFVQWYRKGLSPGTLSLNLSVRQLMDRDFMPYLGTLLEETGCNPEWVEFEVTERQIMKQPAKAIAILSQIKELGIKISVDDFGTGYSSLSYLKRLPIDKLKIDHSFVRDLPDNEENIAIVQAIVALGESLNLDIIAEGVETQEQQDFLINHGCIKGQGFLYSKPINAEAMEHTYLSRSI